MRTASLPMYNLPAMRAANAAVWEAIGGLLREAGIPDVPAALSFERPAVPPAIEPMVLFTQTCGFPLQNFYAGQYALLGVPRYDAPGCDAPEIAGPAHGGVFLVRDGHPAARLQDLRGSVLACNSLHSNSGMNLPRRSLAPLAGGKPFFSRVIFTGTHPNSLAAVRSGEADVTAIDNLTYVFHADYQPEAVAGLRILARTVPSPAIPFVTSVATDTRTQSALKAALRVFAADPRFAAVRRAVRITSIEAPEGSDYGLLLRYEAEAAALGYPELV
jgi:ABC-type phosphate/phosphonate transport system substrate-binding protein